MTEIPRWFSLLNVPPRGYGMKWLSIRHQLMFRQGFTSASVMLDSKLAKRCLLSKGFWKGFCPIPIGGIGQNAKM
ncbi:TPA: hypothetical protein ACIZB4_000581 [Legionella pneumophila]|nr:hypothetical protein [Legionella pneumophila]MCH9119678.1 hypothetical protein [Legionella pneumophila serogroup 1]ANH11544.1 hypothetical protein A5478_00330 [Legionella pneumophila]ANH14513.1 hypothetical protein A5480_00330 [Legionella pneumophila]ANH17479.1 hypothetical protein A5479_00330 [Legionella pneumophila]APX18360.1 hypothetical protein A1D14_00330 [Legionella pneumophila]